MKEANDPALPVVTIDILGNVLGRADHPGEAGKYLSEEIRELTGARCVIFAQFMDQPSDGPPYRVVAINPTRNIPWAQSEEAHVLYRWVHGQSATQLLHAEQIPELSEILGKRGYDLSLAMPLNAGTARVGDLILLGLPDEHGIASLLAVLNTLSSVIALVLRNAFLFENQEQVIAERTRQLQASNETLRQSESRFRALFEQAGDYSFIIDPAGGALTIIDANEAACRIHGCTREELLGTSVLDLDTGLTIHRSREISERVMAGDPVRFESTRRRKDGSSFAVEVCAKMVWVDARTQVIFTTERDISERKRAEEERKALEVQLTQAQKMESVGRLAGGVAHDFNNMLGVILGHLELAADLVKPDDPIRADLEEIRKAAERSADLTRQLLAFARKQTVAPEVLDLNDAVDGMLKMLRRLIGEDIDLIWMPAPTLWPVRIDPVQVSQILANLCVNARDAITREGRITIETGNAVFDENYCTQHPGYVPGQYVALNVSDNGCGMDKETIANIFEPFYTSKGVGKGTGLGLATIYGIVRQNQGFINVYSELDLGSTFKIYLPHYQSSTPRAGAKDASKDVEGSETVLLVEDEPAILKMSRIMLERLGYTVLPASSPAEAIRLAEAHKGEIHLLMTDVVMPGMNGRDLAERMLSNYPTLKLLFMSGYTADVIAHQGVLDQGVHFIQKPFSKHDLATKIRQALKAD